MPSRESPPLSLNGADAGGAVTNNCEQPSSRCAQPFRLTCATHGEAIVVPCGRWRSCSGCAVRKQWEISARLKAGIEQAPSPFHPMFFTLTFPRDQAPDENAAHAALRSLVQRLRYRGYLSEYAWVLQRQKNGTLHHHGIAWLPWFDDDLAEWRRLVVASGFGVQNRLVVANRSHAGYCARYVSGRFAALAPMRRAYSFSRGFPQTPYKTERARLAEVGAPIGLQPECEWLPTYLFP